MNSNDHVYDAADRSDHSATSASPDTDSVAAMHSERHRLLGEVADWAHMASLRVGKSPEAVLQAPESCSMSTAFALLAEGADLLADLGRSRAAPIEDFQAEYWFDMRTFGLADGT